VMRPGAGSSRVFLRDPSSSASSARDGGFTGTGGIGALRIRGAGEAELPYGSADLAASAFRNTTAQGVNTYTRIECANKSVTGA
jgi:hypothetical protein